MIPKHRRRLVQKVSTLEVDQIENIIANNYNITPTPMTTTMIPMSTPGQRVYDYTGQNQQYQNNQFQNQNNFNNQQNYGNTQPQYQNTYNNQQYSGTIPSQQYNSVGFIRKWIPLNLESTTLSFYGTIIANYVNGTNFNTNLRNLQITSDSGIVSETATAIDSFTQNGNTMVRVFQFTYVTDLGRQGQPNLGDWKRILFFK